MPGQSLIRPFRHKAHNPLRLRVLGDPLYPFELFRRVITVSLKA